MSTVTATPIPRPEGRSLDRAGICLSTACAIHCIAMPFALGALAVGGLEWLASETAEVLLLGSAFLVGVASLVPSYLRHRNPVALMLFFCGLLLIGGAHLLLEEHTPTLGVLMALGGGLVALAHYRNRQVCHCHA